MDAAWPKSRGEAIHTSTFLGHPVGCAMALAQISEIRARNLPQRSADLGEVLVDGLHAIVALINPPLQRGVSRQRASGNRFNGFRGGLRAEARGLGLLAGLELRTKDGSPATDQALH